MLESQHGVKFAKERMRWQFEYKLPPHVGWQLNCVWPWVTPGTQGKASQDTGRSCPDGQDIPKGGFASFWMHSLASMQLELQNVEDCQPEVSEDKSGGWQNDWTFTERTQKDGSYIQAVCTILRISRHISQHLTAQVHGDSQGSQVEKQLQALTLSREQQWEMPGRHFAVRVSQGRHLLGLKPVLTSWSLKEWWPDLFMAECERGDMKVLLKHGFKRELSNPLIGHQKKQKSCERQYICEYLDKSWDLPHSKEGQNVWF